MRATETEWSLLGLCQGLRDGRIAGEVLAGSGRRSEPGIAQDRTDRSGGGVVQRTVGDVHSAAISIEHGVDYPEQTRCLFVPGFGS